MSEYEVQQPRPENRRRRKPTQMEIFKQKYLPAIIVCVALVLIVIFVIGSISRGIQRAKLNNTDSTSVSQDVSDVMAQAKAYADGYDYDKAIEILDSYSGKKSSEITKLKKAYKAAQKDLVLWEDNSKVLHLSFEQLIADPTRAFADGNYNDHLTVTEFTKILQQLYENGYILISMDDIAQSNENDAGDKLLSNKSLYLPKDKKPLIITQTGVNYYTYMVDSDEDKFPDQDAPGFASRLILDENGNLACELVDTDGSTVSGAYDLVPVLESFITTHPDFSYRGARAILAVTGYDGLFGYRTSAAAAEYFGPAYQKKELLEAKTVISALRQSGYEIACCTYGDIAYGSSDIATIHTDLDSWATEVAPVLEQVDIFVFVKDGDIAAPGTAYSDEKYSALAVQGFAYYVGYNDNGAPWLTFGDIYLRQGRLEVTADAIKNNADWFSGVFDAATVLETGR